MENKPSDKTIFAMDLTAKMVVEQLAQETKLPQEELLLEFMKSNTAKMLYDDSTKLWWDGPSAVAEEFKSQRKEEKAMNKPKFETPDLTQKNIDKISQLFHNCITETKDENGNLKKAVNFELLQQMLSDEIADKDEAYEFTWVGKNAAIVEANKPIRKTLRPCKEESVNWDTTENLYIEGDNLEVLKLLQESYLGKVKMIYIDPPYNTGNDFIYKDDFTSSSEEYAEETGLFDDEGNRMFKNTDTNGRFHSDWCSMIYSRLMLARNLLSDDGVIFISIDDNEVENLKKICCEIFGQKNFQGHIHWRRRHNQPNDKTKMLGIVTEHIIVFSKNTEYLKSVGVGKIDLTGKFSNPDNDPKGPWATKPWKVGSDQNGSHYIIKTPTGKIYDEDWMGDETTYKELLADGRIQFPDNGNGSPRKKYYQSERAEEGQCATNWWSHEQFGHNQGGNDTLTELFGVKNVFSNPKPLELLRGIMQVANVKNNDVILDFFSGSGATAHELLQFNNENSIHAKFITIQIQENLDESLKVADSKTKKQIEVAINFLNSITKPHLITEIGKERIRRVGKKIKEENPLTTQNLDIGFRVLKVDDSNMKDVYYSASEYDQGKLDMFESNIKEDRNDLDLLFGCLLDWGLPLSLPYTSETIGKFTVHTYNDGDLVACFNEDISEEVVKEIARKKPLRAVFRDSSFSNSASKINVFEIFKMISPETSVKVI